MITPSDNKAADSRSGRWDRVARWALALLAAAQIVFVIFLLVNHVNFPLHLDIMEGTVLQHFRQIVNGRPIYPPPTPEYVPLSYNALYYVASLPLSWLLGANLLTLRLMAIVGMLGSAFLVYWVVRQKTGSRWWGWLALGLFAASYRAMETYLDNAHSDSWLLFTALLGTYIIARNRSRGWNIVGLLVLIASFWFKQHGALFVIGGVLFLTWRVGLRRSIVYWVIAAVLGPGLYLLGGPALFGSYFHVFTWRVPSQWSEVSLETFIRYLRYIARYYGVLAVAGVFMTGWTALKDRRYLSAWHVQFVFAMLTGLMGTLDIGSANNVYIPMSAFFIIMGVWGLAQSADHFRVMRRFRLDYAALFLSFVLLAYDPRTVIVSPRAHEAYSDLIQQLNSLPGKVYAPSLGQLQSDFTFSPAAHWIALEDMIRGPGRDTRDHPNTRALLQAAWQPTGPAYILANYPLDVYPWLEFLGDYYVLEADYGDRFEPLRPLPKRFEHGWPRYLYRFQAGEN